MAKLERKIPKCLDCGREFKSGQALSIHVQTEHGYSSYFEYRAKWGLAKTNQMLLEEGAVTCKLCGLISHDLTAHILKKHKLNIEEYKTLYGPVRSAKYLREQSERISGDKNPAFNHGGKFSSLSVNFIYADKVNKDEIIEKISNSIKTNGNNSTTLNYWLKQGFSEEESRQKLSERQTTFSLEKCILKYGEVEGRKRWVDRQKKWLDSTKESRMKGFSEISQELFWLIFEKLDDNKKDNIYFAQLSPNKFKDISGVNYEYTIKLATRALLPDFLDIKTKKIIEFDGTYWHGKHKIKYPNRLRDDVRDELLMAEGYQVLHIKEEEYKKSPNFIVNTCLEFLNG
jgi:very-short-patch-repair endonuclease